MTRIADAETTVLVDCRWLGQGGVGRVTEHLLRGWNDRPPPGRWLLWGPPTLVEPFRWPQAQMIPGVPTSTPIRDQHRMRALPRYDIALFLHQIHAIPRRPYVTLVHDTIPLRWGGSSYVRFLKRTYLKILVVRAERVITDSEFSRDRIHADLKVPRGRIHIVEPAVDHSWGQRIATSRLANSSDPMALVVGRFAKHKNIERLVRAFGATDFARSGGILMAVGADADDIQRMGSVVRGLNLGHCIQLRGRCTQDELDRYFIRARFLISPSLEEGYGLPAREAMIAGIPTCLSTGGALSVLAPYAAACFDPWDEQAMTKAIDVAALSASAPKAFQHLFPDEATYSSRVAGLMTYLARCHR